MKNKVLNKIFSLLAVGAMALSGCGSKAAAPQVDPIDDNFRVFYEIFVGSFSDSDGDGIGDIQGIINRLDYLNDGDINSGRSLGVQGLWLTPIFASPSYHGYDVSDYYRVNERYGSDADLRQLVDECHKRNIKVILDLPINHTSTSNTWFMKFKEAHKDGLVNDQYYDYYSWATLSDRQGGITYSGIPGSQEYYECNFSTDMPELNFDNPAVRELTLEVAKYWLDFGIDGFRFDAAKYIYFNDLTKSVDFWKWYMAELRDYKADVYCVGEVWSGEGETMEYVTALNCFNFQLGGAEGYLASAAAGSVAKYTQYVERYQSIIAEKNPVYGMSTGFVSNHDQDRAAGYLSLANKRAYMAANLYLLAPGSPFMYYGEEIGMKGTRGAANTDANRRLKMNWGDGDTVRNPQGADYADSKQNNGTAKEQIENEDSLYNHYCKVIAFRNQYPEIARGTYKSLSFSEVGFGGFAISYNGETSYLLHNTNDDEMVITLDVIATDSDYKLQGFVGQGSAKLDKNKLTIGGKTSVLIK